MELAEYTFICFCSYIVKLNPRCILTNILLVYMICTMDSSVRRCLQLMIFVMIIEVVIVKQFQELYTTGQAPVGDIIYNSLTTHSI